jgi:hypothetical protein
MENHLDGHSVEVKVRALEWALLLRCQLSVDVAFSVTDSEFLMS